VNVNVHSSQNSRLEGKNPGQGDVKLVESPSIHSPLRLPGRGGGAKITTRRPTLRGEKSSIEDWNVYSGHGGGREMPRHDKHRRKL